MKKRILVLSLAILVAGLFVSPKVCFGEDILASCTVSCSFCFRHNPAGYWYLTGNGGSAIMSDSSVSSGSPCCTGSALLSHMLPKEAVSALKEHPGLKVRLERTGSASCLDFGFFAYRFTGPGTMDLELRIIPSLASESLGSYVPGLSSPVPLVDYSCGRNIYIVYPLIGEGAYAYGFYSEGSPGWVSSPLIHPSQIKDKEGHFRSGTTINVNGLNKNAAFYTVGKKGTLALEDAVVLEFFCPFRLVFYTDSEGGGDTNAPFPGEWQVVGSEEPPAAAEETFTLKLHRKR